MKRRDFLAATCLTGLASITSAQAAPAKPKKTRQLLFELRKYILESAEKQKQLLDFLSNAEIPALNKIKIENVGVFTQAEGDSKDIYVLVPHKSLRSLVKAQTMQASDPEYAKAGAKILNTPKDDPAYARVESSLLLAFSNAPKLEIPSKKDTRVFQLRIYESHNAMAAEKKIEMFNTGGEIAVFKKTGLNPVFFGKSIVGDKLPNLTYMIGFDDEKAQEQGWNNFRKDPDWLALKAKPEYKGLVSNITNIVLKPAACSQI